MRAKKRPIIALLLAFALIFTLMPMTAYAANTVSVGTSQALYDAFSNASNGDTIKLTADITYNNNRITIDKDVTLDFNGHSITFLSLFDIESGTLNLVNAQATGEQLVGQNNGILNISGTSGDGLKITNYVVYDNEKNGVVNITDAVISGGCYILYYSYGEADISNTEFEGYHAVYMNFGTCTMTKVDATIYSSLVDENYGHMVFNDCTVDSEDYGFPIEDQYSDYISTYGVPSCVINGGTYTGEYLNCCMYGDLVVNGGTFEAYCSLYLYNRGKIVFNDADFTVHDDYVFYIEYEDSEVTFCGGTYKTDDDNEVVIYADDNCTIILKGGTFIANDGTQALYAYDYDSYIIPKGYMAIPEDWQETGASQVTIVPTAYRYAGKNRYATAIKAADALKEELEIEKFDSVILACGSNYADALAGSYLATVKSAPILLVDGNQAAIDTVQAYINANLTSGGTIYVLGGTGAVPDSAVAGLTGFEVKRLKGANRYDTNIAILEEAGVSGDEILVCSGTGFADSLSASATGLPILLVGASIMDNQKDYISALSGKDFYIIGGKGAVNLDIESYFSKLGDVTRIGGSNRFETSTNVAREFFDYPDRAVLAYAMNFPDGLSGGPLAYAMGGPLILASNGNSAKAAAYAKEATIRAGVVLGGTSLISDDEVKTIFALPKNVQVVAK